MGNVDKGGKLMLELFCEDFIYHYLAHTTNEEKSDIEMYMNSYIEETKRKFGYIQRSEAIVYLSEHKKEVSSRINKYGKMKMPVLYARYNNIILVEKLLTSSIKDIAIQMNEVYAKKADKIGVFYFYYNMDEAYYEMEIAERFGDEYTLDFITLIIQVILFELNKAINKEVISTALKIVTDDIKDDKIGNLLINFYDTRVIGVFDILQFLSPSVLFRVLDYDFKSRDNWPFKDNIYELLIDRLNKFKFSGKTLRKMQLLGSDRYEKIDIGSALHILVLKNILGIINSTNFKSD